MAEVIRIKDDKYDLYYMDGDSKEGQCVPVPDSHHACPTHITHITVTSLANTVTSTAITVSLYQ